MAWTPPNYSPELAVVERLKLCALDFGVTSAWALMPTHRLEREALPAAYHWWGATVPLTTADGVMLTTARQFTQRVLIKNINDGASDIGADSEVFRAAIEWPFRVAAYYQEHPFLSTSELDELPYCLGLIPYPGKSPLIQDNGVTKVPGPNSEEFAAIDFTLTVKMSYPLPYGGTR